MTIARKEPARPPVRVRREPPTIEEAVFAAQGLTDEPQQQTEIAAALMGVSADEVRPYVERAAARERALRAQPHRAISAGPRRHVVVVERRTRLRAPAASRLDR